MSLKIYEVDDGWFYMANTAEEASNLYVTESEIDLEYYDWQTLEVSNERMEKIRIFDDSDEKIYSMKEYFEDWVSRGTAVPGYFCSSDY